MSRADTTSVPDIPSNWDLIPLTYVSNSIETGNRDASFTPSSEDPGVLSIGGEHFDEDGNWRLDSPRHISESMYESMKKGKIDEGDILIVKDGATTGKTAYVENVPEGRAAVNTHVYIVKPGNKIQNELLAYQIKSSWIQNQIQLFVRGSAQAGLPSLFANEVFVSVPPKDEQTKILNHIKKKDEEINKTVEKLEHILLTIGEKQVSFIENITTSGIQQKQTKEVNSLETIDRIPENWEVHRAKNLFTQRDERGYDDLPLLEVSLNHGIRLRDDNEDRDAWVASDLNDMKLVKKGDIVFNKMRLWQGAIGKSDYEGLVSPDYTVLNPNSKVNPSYYNQLIQTEAYKTEVDRRSYGVVDDRKRIYWTQFGDLPLLYPPYNDQDEIVESINDSNCRIDDLRSKIEDLISTLRNKRQALITAAVTGQIDIPEVQGEKQVNA